MSKYQSKTNRPPEAGSITDDSLSESNTGFDDYDPSDRDTDLEQQEKDSQIDKYLEENNSSGISNGCMNLEDLENISDTEVQLTPIFDDHCLIERRSSVEEVS